MYKVTKHIKPFVFNGNTTFELISNNGDTYKYLVKRDEKSRYTIYYLLNRSINIGTVNVIEETVSIKDNINTPSSLVVLSLARRLMRELIITYFKEPVTIDIYYDGCCVQCGLFVADEEFRSTGSCQQCYNKRKYGKVTKGPSIEKLYRIYRNPQAFIFSGASRFYLFDDNDKRYAFKIEKVKGKRNPFIICYLPNIDIDADALYVGRVNWLRDEVYIRSRITHDDGKEILNLAESFFKTIITDEVKEFFIFYKGNCGSCGKFIDDNIVRMTGVCKRCSK